MTAVCSHSSTPSKLPPPASIQTLTETLRERDAIEVLKNVAKAMLYEAYLKVIGGG
jgi:hypothetical protein